jgi:hypothetical protein
MMSCCGWFYYSRIDTNESENIITKQSLSATNDNKTCKKSMHKKKRNTLQVPIRFLKKFVVKIKTKNRM